MKIYVNSQGRICALRSTDRTDLTEFEFDREYYTHMCDAVLLCYMYMPYYKMDENGEYILDEQGNKIQAGYSIGPAIDYNIIQAIQHLYELEVGELKQETAAVAEYQIELDYRVSCQELGL